MENRDPNIPPEGIRGMVVRHDAQLERILDMMREVTVTVGELRHFNEVIEAQGHEETRNRREEVRRLEGQIVVLTDRILNLEDRIEYLEQIRQVPAAQVAGGQLPFAGGGAPGPYGYGFNEFFGPIYPGQIVHHGRHARAGRGGPNPRRDGDNHEARRMDLNRTLPVDLRVPARVAVQHRVGTPNFLNAIERVERIGEEQRQAVQPNNVRGAIAKKSDASLLMERYFTPVHAFREAVLREFFVNLKEDSVVEVEHHDFKENLEKGCKTYWIAKILKVAGYRIKLAWMGADKPGDEAHQFWMNMGSRDVNSVGHAKTSKGPKKVYAYVPPQFLVDRLVESGEMQSHITNILEEAAKHPAIRNLNDIRKKAFIAENMKEGSRVELLDYNHSNRLRPALILQNVMGRLSVTISKDDCEEHDEDDRQFDEDSQFWVDQNSFFVFPVGWATHNGYGLAAKKPYRAHTERIAQALKAGTPPPYADIDVQPHQIQGWRKKEQPGQKWEKGMRFELMDPLGATVCDLYVASCLEVLKDGYLRVAMDGPDADEDCIAVHCTSPLLFPIGYAKKHGIKLHGPDDEEEEGGEFDWVDYIKSNGGLAAPIHLFKEDPSVDKITMFKVGAQLEAADLCENVLICSATIVSTKGRLIHVRFDGWDESFDQYFDIDCNDLFPVGWCELNGYKLEAPKKDKPKKK